MADYATLADLRLYGYQSQTSDESLLQECLTRASRAFDNYVNVPENYFASGSSGQSASARYYWGDGTDYLQIDPYLASTITAVTLPSTYDTPTYIESNPNSTTLRNATSAQFLLIRTYGDDSARTRARATGTITAYNGWPKGLRATVTAKWGYDSIPQDIQEAVLETAIAIWRGRDQGFSRVVNLESNIQVIDAMPARAKMIANGYVNTHRAMFA